MELTRRQFVQSAVLASAANMPLALSEARSPESIMDITLGWGFPDDGTASNEAMAAQVVEAFERNLAWYQVRGFRKEPEWTFRKREDGKDIYKLTCRPYVVHDGAGHPIRNCGL